MGFRTIREGEQAIIYKLNGEGNLIIGPQRVYLFLERLEKLALYQASQYEYLVVKMNSGLMEHISGPCSMFCNPLEHQSIDVKPAVKIDSNHVLVVYKQLPDNSMQRRIIQGPTLFMPEAGERLHEFVWHGQDESTEGRMIPAYHKFTHVAVIPDQFYFNVSEVRTTDDTLLSVKLMLFYEMTDILKMLEATHDPIADMINAVCADIIAFAGKLTFQDFLAQVSALSGIESYPQLTQRAESIGYKVTKVVYRGYHASQKLQAMQDSAIKSRTELRLNADFLEQQQKLIDYKLEKEEARTKLKQDMEKCKQTHRQNIDKLKQMHASEMEEKKHLMTLECQQMETEADLECVKRKEMETVDHLKKLNNLGVDLTKYLVCKSGAPISQEYQIVRD